MSKKSAFVELGGVKIRLGKHISREVEDHLLAGLYELAEMNVLREKLEPEDVVLELGTGIGLLAAYCAQRIGSDRVFTYEANPALERHIRDTFALNDVAPALEMCMLTDRVGEETLYVQEAFWESSTVPGNSALKAIRVPTKSFNEEVERINPTFLIVDIEGGEYDLCRHMKFHNIRKVLLECHRDKIGARNAMFVKSFLYRAGFRVERRLSKWEVVFLKRQ